MLDKVIKLTLISRPISWVNTAYPFGAALLLSGGKVDTLFWVGVVYFLIPYNLLMYGVNDVYDYESDIKNPRKGGVEGMKEARAFHPTILRAVVWSNAPFLLFLLAAGDWPSRAVLTLVVFAAIAYS